jgi:cytochrome c551/c552
MRLAPYLASAALAAGLFLAQAAVAASAENGKQVFMRAGCWQCHGTIGQGAATGPKLAPDRRAVELCAHDQSRDAGLSRRGPFPMPTSLISIPICSRSRRALTRRPSRYSADRGRAGNHLREHFNEMLTTSGHDLLT